MRAHSKIKTILQMSSLIALMITVPLALAGNDDDCGYDFEFIPLSDCQVGNLNPPVGPPVPDIFMGDESYAYHIFPAEQCDSNDEGFILESITQLLHFNADQVPALLNVQPSLLEAVFDTGTDCWVPGPSIYDGPIQTFSIEDCGIITIETPTPDAPALFLADHYFLALHYSGNALAQLVVDDDPQPCTEFINRGSGWEDLNGRKRSGGGKVIIFGDIIFAPASVNEISTTWDGIKSLYK